MNGTTAHATLAMAFAAALGCPAADPGVRAALSEDRVTLSGEAWVFTAEEPLPADAFSLGVCLTPGPGHNVSGRWTVRAPDGREARVVARAELTNGEWVKLAAPSSRGNRLCVHPRRGGPFEAPVRRLSLVASTPIVVEQVAWHAGGP